MRSGSTARDTAVAECGSIPHVLNDNTYLHVSVRIGLSERQGLGLLTTPTVCSNHLVMLCHHDDDASTEEAGGRRIEVKNHSITSTR